MSFVRLFSALLPLGAMVLLAACGAGGDPQAAAPPPTPVQLVTVAPTAVREMSEFVANLRSRRSVTLLPRVEGRIVEIAVQSGDQVAAGAPLMRIDPENQQASVREAEAALAAARADAESARETLAALQRNRAARTADVALARQEYERYRQLVSEGAAARQQLDERVNRLRVARSEQEALEAQIRAQQAVIRRSERLAQQAQATLTSQRVQLGYFTVDAPFAGTVADIPVKVGDYVTPQTRLTAVNQNQPLEVLIPVPIERAPDLRVGQRVEVLGAQNQVIGAGEVVFVSPQADTTSQTILAKAVTPNRDNRLRADQFVTARLIWGERQGITVPTTAISRLGGQSFVFVAREASEGDRTRLVASQKPVQLGAIQGNRYVVRSGLAAGERVVVSGVQNLADGAPIAPAAARPAA